MRRLLPSGSGVMSGTPGSDPDAKYPSWVVNPWDGVYMDVLDYQWSVAAEFWREIDELAQASDVRIAVDSAGFGMQEVKWAIIPAGGSLVRLVRQMPYCKAMEILLTGNRIDAQEAWRIGLVNYVVPQDRLMARAEELAATIAANGPLAVRKIKEAVRRASGRTLEEAFKIENEIAREVMRSEDAKEGPRSFMEKRKPNYKGR